MFLNPPSTPWCRLQVDNTHGYKQKNTTHDILHLIQEEDSLELLSLEVRAFHRRDLCMYRVLVDSIRMRTRICKGRDSFVFRRRQQFLRCMGRWMLM